MKSHLLNLKIIMTFNGSLVENSYRINIRYDNNDFLLLIEIDNLYSYNPSSIIRYSMKIVDLWGFNINDLSKINGNYQDLLYHQNLINKALNKIKQQMSYQQQNTNLPSSDYHNYRTYMNTGYGTTGLYGTTGPVGITANEPKQINKKLLLLK